jgi:hypothetical protein
MRPDTGKKHETLPEKSVKAEWAWGHGSTIFLEILA